MPTPLPSSTPHIDPAFPSTLSTQESSSGLTANVAAALAVLLTLITGLIFLFLEKRSQYVRFWAMQSVFFGAAWLVFSIVSTVIHLVLGSILFVLGLLWGLIAAVVYLTFLIVWIVMLIQAFNGKEWELPVLGPLARQQLAKMPLL